MNQSGDQAPIISDESPHLESSFTGDSGTHSDDPGNLSRSNMFLDDVGPYVSMFDRKNTPEELLNTSIKDEESDNQSNYDH